jgi:hypothetical protein
MTLDPYLGNRRRRDKEQTDKKATAAASSAMSASDYYTRIGELFAAERWRDCIQNYDECLRHESSNSERWLNAMFNRGHAKAIADSIDQVIDDVHRGNCSRLDSSARYRSK